MGETVDRAAMIEAAQHDRPRAVLSISLRCCWHAMQSFERETVVIYRVTHPNVDTAHDAGQSNGVYCLMMKYVVVSAMHATLQAARGLEVKRLMSLASFMVPALFMVMSNRPAC
jgi:hypothetical protein